jgi:hypothetical protein
MAVQRQRRAGKGYRASLTDEQIRLLDEINFPLSLKRGRSDRAWRTKYQEVVDFYKQNEHLHFKYKSSLYNWMVTQRQRRGGKGSLEPPTDEQIRLLDEIEFSWTPKLGRPRKGRPTIYPLEYEQTRFLDEN